MLVWSLDAEKFDIAHAKTIEGRTWINDLPKEMQFGGKEGEKKLVETRNERYKAFQPMIDAHKKNEEDTKKCQDKVPNSDATPS